MSKITLKAKKEQKQIFGDDIVKHISPRKESQLQPLESKLGQPHGVPYFWQQTEEQDKQYR